MSATISPLREPDIDPEPGHRTMPPKCGEPPFVCPGLERAAEEIGYLREQLDWQIEATSRIALHFGIELPPRPLPYPNSR